MKEAAVPFLALAQFRFPQLRLCSLDGRDHGLKSGSQLADLISGVDRNSMLQVSGLNDRLRAVLELSYRLDDKPAHAGHRQRARQQQRQREEPRDPVRELPYLVVDLLAGHDRADLPTELSGSVVKEFVLDALLSK